MGQTTGAAHIGATAYAQVVVLAVFMGGLALGAFLFGRRSDRNERPLRSYVILELSIGGYCLVLPLLLYLAGLSYVSLATHFFELSGFTLLLRFVLVTLPTLFRSSPPFSWGHPAHPRPPSHWPGRRQAQ